MLSSKPQVEGHWHSLIEGFATSSLDFYELVKAGIARRQIPDLKISQVEWKESGLGSGKRSYLRVSREGLNFDICAAPFGTGYFFSWWLAKIPRVLLDFAVLFGIAFAGLICLAIAGREGCGGIVAAPIGFFGMLFGLGFLVRYGEMGLEPTVLSMPITGFLYAFFFRPQTYFNEDTAIMFRESVHHAVLEAIDQVTTAQGVRGLSEEARKITFRPGGKG
jgi:hypothetical protein